MKKFTILVVITALMGVFSPVSAVSRNRERCRAEVMSRSRGFYKDIFMDGGIALTSRYHLPSARFVGAQMEYFASSSKKRLSEVDTLNQAQIYCGYEKDVNGWLLYPDGAPRFRVIYVNGGNASQHATSLTEQGRETLRRYVAAGGSYIGTCAGAYLGSAGHMKKSGPTQTELYLHLWPGYTRYTGLRKTQTAMRLDRKSPLWRYYDFGKDRQVKDVRHNGGCFAYEDRQNLLPKGTEPLAYYIYNNTPKVKLDGKIGVWAYKESEKSGRVILCGSHPEAVAQGERLEFMSAMLLYAMDGNPQPELKGELKEGDVREMNRRTEENDPKFTRIGDRQYHHFALDIPKRCKRAIVSIEGYEGESRFDLTLCAKRGEMAFHDNTLHKVVSRGCKKSLVVERPKSGRWYVSVFCETTVTSTVGKYGTRYSGRLSVLNGVPYKISVKYE